ncbi:hybrid sensor histidine kinase/response regulator [Lyngbya sp. PCC 8106]|uniref:hybrid sensor histidine kinase/response regulator n=1 Tax=Lyngbya sp. (strain PCC 8106) TaxID=313612 RepID=UPI0000EA8A90|nr:hybrid sensor histidine kinase/response regulator [Lyngbya sp. PCC 8106]EAW37251.1 PAS sensor signal transduction histidine kinase [Lyngbya sp. PCC 8106]
MSQELIKVLLVEDNPGDAFLIQESLKKRHKTKFKVTQVERLKDAFSCLESDQFDLVLLDLFLLDSQGLNTFTEISLKANHLPIVVLTGLNDEEMAIQAVRLGAQDYLKKELAMGEVLIYSLCYAIERKRTQEQLKQQKIQLETTNAELKKRTKQLEILNDELEAFSYTVSHDLRSPLLSIDGFSFFLEKEHSESLNSQGKSYLKRIRQAVSRMDKLIINLLELSRVQQIEMCITEVNLSEIVQTLFKDLKQQDTQRKVKLKIAPNVTVQGNKQLLKIALENLISNAWKYTAQEEVATIQFGVLFASEQNIDSHLEIEKKRLNSEIDFSPIRQTPIYFIGDNGVGFDMYQADKLFTPFQRLHSAGEFQGTGIGLATVQRIIHRHQGKIWAKSTQGKGATFYFTLS